jgi:MoaA/NifB/PqqE/SkfB family radical SAM enzyme
MITLRAEYIDEFIIEFQENKGIKFETPLFISESKEQMEYSYPFVNNILAPKIVKLFNLSIALFTTISIETQTGCNLTCSFCPVNKLVDKRIFTQLEFQVLEKIALELNVLCFNGTVNLYVNNEPLMDKRISDIIFLFRKHLPLNKIKILTNGTLLTNEKIHTLFQNGLSELSIDNYTDGKKLITPIKKLINNSMEFINYDIRISMRKINDNLTNRAGTSPNVSPLRNPIKQFCAFPFLDFTISAFGKSIICNLDTTDAEIMGDVKNDTILNIWTNSKYSKYREFLKFLKRQSINICSKCDYDGFRSFENINRKDIKY